MDQAQRSALASALVLASAAGISAYHVATTKKSTKEIEEYQNSDAYKLSVKTSSIGEREWVKTLGQPLRYIMVDIAMINTLDSLSVFRHGAPDTFHRLCIELENFYAYYLQISPRTAASREEAFRALPVMQKYMSNIDLLIRIMKRRILETYPPSKELKVNAIQSRLNYRTGIILNMIKGFYENIFKDCSMYCHRKESESPIANDATAR